MAERTYRLYNMDQTVGLKEIDCRRHLLLLPLLSMVDFKAGYRKNRERRNYANYLVSETRVLILINTIHIKSDGEVQAFLMQRNTDVYADYMKKRGAALDIVTITDEELNSKISNDKVTLKLL